MKPIKQHTLETVLARADEVGNCLEWSGAFNGKSPLLKIGRKPVQVRRFVREQLGKPIPEGHFATVSCGNHRCIKPEHIMHMPAGAFMAKISAEVDHQNPIRTAKIRRARCHARLFTEEQAMQIRLDPRPSREVAQQYGCSHDLVNKIRAGRSYKPLHAGASPFSGLIR